MASGLTVAQREALLNKRISEAANQFEGFTKKQTRFALAELKRTENDLVAQLAKAVGDDGKIKRERLTSILKDVKRTKAEIAKTLSGAMDTSITETSARAYDDFINGFQAAGVGVASIGVEFNRLNEYVFKYTTQRYGDDGLILSDRIWTFAGSQEEQLNTVVRNGIIQGQAITEITRNIAAVGVGSAYAIERLVRTEVNTAYRSAFAYSAQQSKLVQYIKIIKGQADRPEHKCSIYAKEDNYGVGAGLFLPTDTKILNPHPNCTSYLLYELIPEAVTEAVRRTEDLSEPAPGAIDTPSESDEALVALAQAKNAKEVGKWATKNLPLSHVDLNEFDTELARDMVEQIYVLQQRFPEGMGSFQGIGTAQGFYKKGREAQIESMYRANVVRMKSDGTPMFPDTDGLRKAIEKKVPLKKVSSNTNAFATRWGMGFDGVYINKNLAKDYPEFKKRKKQAAEVDWSLVGTPTGTISHEYGHMLDYWLKENHPEARVRIIDDIFDVAIKQDEAWWGRNISRYGRTNDMEFFAETFSDYVHHGENAKALSKEVGKRLEAELKSIRGQ